MIPTNFEDWRSCITDSCGIALTPAFARERLSVYQDPKHPETVKFVQCYGDQHLHHIIMWYERIV